jgi:hypothetical protein
VAALGCGAALGALYVPTLELALPAITALTVAGALATVTYGNARNTLAVPTALLLGPVAAAVWDAVRDAAFDDQRLWVIAAVPIVLAGTWIAPSIKTFALTTFVVLGAVAVYIGGALQDDEIIPWHMGLALTGLAAMWFGPGAPFAAWRDDQVADDSLQVTTARAGIALSAEPAGRVAVEHPAVAAAADDDDDDDDDDEWQFRTLTVGGVRLTTILIVVVLALGALWGVGRIVALSRDAVAASSNSLRNGR